MVAEPMSSFTVEYFQTPFLPCQTDIRSANSIIYRPTAVLNIFVEQILKKCLTNKALNKMYSAR